MAIMTSMRELAHSPTTKSKGNGYRIFGAIERPQCTLIVEISPDPIEREITFLERSPHNED